MVEHFGPALATDSTTSVQNILQTEQDLCQLDFTVFGY